MCQQTPRNCKTTNHRPGFDDGGRKEDHMEIKVDDNALRFFAEGRLKMSKIMKTVGIVMICVGVPTSLILIGIPLLIGGVAFLCLSSHMSKQSMITLERLDQKGIRQDQAQAAVL